MGNYSLKHFCNQFNSTTTINSKTKIIYKIVNQFNVWLKPFLNKLSHSISKTTPKFLHEVKLFIKPVLHSNQCDTAIWFSEQFTQICFSCISIPMPAHELKSNVTEDHMQEQRWKNLTFFRIFTWCYYWKSHDISRFTISSLQRWFYNVRLVRF